MIFVRHRYTCTADRDDNATRGYVTGTYARIMYVYNTLLHPRVYYTHTYIYIHHKSPGECNLRFSSRLAQITRLIVRTKVQQYTGAHDRYIHKHVQGRVLPLSVVEILAMITLLMIMMTTMIRLSEYIVICFFLSKFIFLLPGSAAAAK